MRIDRIIDGLPWGSQRASKLALDFDRDFVSLFESQSDGKWTCVGSAALSAPDFSKKIDGLRIEALVRDKHRTPLTLWLPEDQVLCRHYDLMDRHGVAAKAEALRKLEEDSEYSAADLTVSVAPANDGEPVAVLAALRQTVIEATQYAERWGFVPGTISTRAYPDVTAGEPPEFILHETISARAGRLARGTAMATGALLAVSIGGLGAYHLAAPVLQPPTTVNFAAALAAPIFAEDDSRQLGGSPLGPTWIGQAQRIGFQLAPTGDLELLQRTREQRYSRGAPDLVVPTLFAPVTQTEMRVGAVAEAPRRERPGRLFGVVSPDRQPRIAAVAREADPAAVADTRSDRLTDKASTVSAPLLVDTAKLTEEPTGTTNRRAVSRKIASETANDVSEASTDDTEIASTPAPQSAEDASEYAPKKMTDVPTARPESIASTETIAEPTDDTDAANAPETAASEVASTAGTESDSAVSETAQVSVTTAIGRSVPNGDVASFGAPALAAVPIPGQRIAAPAPELDAAVLDGSSVAALSAPRPLIRPRSLITIKPRIDQQSISTSRTQSRNTLKSQPTAPRTVRAAANQHGLELGQASLIGVIEARSGRKALVRLPTGDYRKVERGDVLDGWRVGTVGRETLRLTRRGQNRTLILVSR